MSEPIPFPGAEPPPPQNPLQVLVQSWRAIVGSPAHVQCADELEKLLQPVALPASLLARLELSVQGGYLTAEECRSLVAALSLVAVFSQSPDIVIRAEVEKMDKNMRLQTNNQVRPVWLANRVQREVTAVMAGRPAGPNGKPVA